MLLDNLQHCYVVRDVKKCCFIDTLLPQTANNGGLWRLSGETLPFTRVVCKLGRTFLCILYVAYS